MIINLILISTLLYSKDYPVVKCKLDGQFKQMQLTFKKNRTSDLSIMKKDNKIETCKYKISAIDRYTRGGKESFLIDLIPTLCQKQSKKIWKHVLPEVSLKVDIYPHLTKSLVQWRDNAHPSECELNKKSSRSLAKQFKNFDRLKRTPAKKK